MAAPPAGPTRDDAILKSAIFGARARTAATAAAPSSPLMLLNRCKRASSSVWINNSATARHACTDAPTFWSDSDSRPRWFVNAAAAARTPFSPSALSLKLRWRKLARDKASDMVRSASSASSS
jgi:hypothetical protein